MQCKNIDEITTREDIRDALEKQFGQLGLQDSAIRGLREAYEGTQTPTVSLPAGKVKIGRVVCRPRKQVTLKRYLEFGHTAAKCTGDRGRSKSCRKCRGESQA